MFQNYKRILISLFFGVTTLFAQTTELQISGKVADSITGAVLKRVIIYITNTNTGVVDSTITNYSGIWQYKFPVTGLDNEMIIPDRFSVSQNYPNPFNPSTRIDLYVPQSGDISVTIFNTRGEIVDAHKQFLSGGAYSIDWHPAVSAGIYFIRVKSSQGTITRKMTLLDGGNGNGLSPFRHSSQTISSGLNKVSAAVSLRFEVNEFGYAPFSLEQEVEGGEYIELLVESVHSQLLLADLHNDILEKMVVDSDYHLGVLHSYNHTDIPRLQQGGVNVQLFVAWPDPGSHLNDAFNHTMDMVSILKNEIDMNPATIGQARTASEALSLVEDDKIAGVLVVEGGHAIQENLDNLKTLYDEGMRYLTITWNNSTSWAISAQDNRSTTTGLNDFGRSVIRMMDSLGIIIDVSHTGIKTIEDILEITKNPIIASHSGARALNDHYRNLYDDQIEAIANTGGVIGVVFYPPFLSSTGGANIATVADHIDHLVNIAGIEHVAIGSDFDGIGTNTVVGLGDVTKFPALTNELLRRGYTEEDLQKILGQNFMRVFEQVCGE